jgi:hypothetical protein
MKIHSSADFGANVTLERCDAPERETRAQPCTGLRRASGPGAAGAAGRGGGPAGGPGGPRWRAGAGKIW